MKTDLFQSCGRCWDFQICWHIECSTFTTSSFRIWYSSTGIPSPPLAFFIVMLPKTLLTSYSRMSGSRCDHTTVIIWVRKIFLYSSSVYSCHLFLISFASVRSIPFLSFCPLWAHLCMKYSLGISDFLEEISSLAHSIVFLYFFSLISKEGFLISPCCSLKLCIQVVYLSFSPLLFSSFLSQLFVRPPHPSILPFCISISWGWSWSLSPLQCHEPLSIVYQALCVSDLDP